MRDSLFDTVTVGASGASDNPYANPATLYKAATIPLRVVVRNVGMNYLHLAFDSANLSGEQVGTVGRFRLPPAASEVFILAPRQGIYALAEGGAGMASIAISEAFPETVGA